jgi:antitoxin component YwqK of YwqJK toxin-antitoxin module
LVAQNDTIFNQTDALGLKQGYWKKEYANGKLMYKGFFKDGRPVGEMQRYYETGEIKAIMKYNNKSEYVKTCFYYNDGELAAEGLYFKEQKDSTWNYYSFYSGKLTATETFNKGLKNGVEKHFYESGQLSEVIEWQNNFKHGAWNQYFEDGTQKLKASNSFNKVTGLYTVCYPNGRLFILGHYIDNKRHGKWTFYEDDGKVKTEIVYNYGKAENEKEIMEKDKEFFKMVDENIGKFSEPTPEDLMQGRGY